MKAISVASVFFGALTYIGNGPNFMVKSISERAGVEMPGFFTYIIKIFFDNPCAGFCLDLADFLLRKRLTEGRLI